MNSLDDGRDPLRAFGSAWADVRGSNEGLRSIAVRSVDEQKDPTRSRQ